MKKTYFCRMKKNLFFLSILIFMFGISSAQTVVFWTNNVDALPIKVYMNGSYIGTITKAYRNDPGCYTSGCVTKQPPYKSNTWKAVSESLGAETSGRYSLVNGCNSFQLFSGGRKLDNNPYQNSSSNYNNSETSSSSGGSGDTGSAFAGLGIVVAGLAVVAGEVILNSDLYVSGIVSDYYSGLEFGFRNNWNDHISFEQTVVWRYTLDKPLLTPFRTDTYGPNPFWGDWESGYRMRSNWGCNFRLLYNFFDRDYTFRNTNFMLNPYVGFGCDYMEYDGFFTSAVAGFTFGSRRVKMDCRYTFGYDFRYQRVPVNQIQVDLIVAYQYNRFGFFRKRR